MKKIVYFFIICLLPLGTYAQKKKNADGVHPLLEALNDVYSEEKAEEKAEEKNRAVWKDRSRYFYFTYMKQTLTHEDVPGLEWKSDFGASFGFGRTFYLHKKPLFKMLKFGLDATWMDFSYAKYSALENGTGTPLLDEDTGYEEEGEELDLGIHQIDFGLHVGPSITLNPVDHLKVSGYFHFVPSGSVIILNDEANANYVSNFAVGGAIAYKVISFGVESRWGKAKYNSFSVNEDEINMDDIESGNIDEDLGIGDALVTGKNNLKAKSLRFYIAFRF